MKIIISPAKSLNLETNPNFSKAKLNTSLPFLLKESKKLINILKKKTVEDIKGLMKISDKLANLNFERYQNWRGVPKNSKPAIFTFQGDVYEGININSYSKADLKYLQDRLFILSGLYGSLKPLDLIEPYRLEMGTKLATDKFENLYQFWGDKIANYINSERKKKDFIVNLASAEYFKSVKKYLAGPVFTPVFLDEVKGKFKVVSFWAKKARGLMVSYLVKHRIKELEEIRNFKEENYFFHSYDEDNLTMAFHRSH